MVKEEWRRGFLKYASERLSRPGGVAAGLRPGQSGVPTDQSVSEGGAVRDGLADTPSGHVDSGEYRGGLGTPLLGGVHPVSPEGQRQSDRAGNSSHSFSRSRALQPGSNQAADQRDDNLGQATRGSRTSCANGKRANRPLARNTIRHSLFATRRFRDPVAQSLRSRVRLGPFPAGRGAAPGTGAGPRGHGRGRARTRAGPRGDPGNRLPLHLWRGQEPAGRGPLPRGPVAGEPHSRQAADVP